MYQFIGCTQARTHTQREIETRTETRMLFFFIIGIYESNSSGHDTSNTSSQSTWQWRQGGREAGTAVTKNYRKSKIERRKKKSGK